VNARDVSTPDGRTLTVSEGGDPNGLPLLFIPGTPGSSLLYEPQVRDAEQRGIRLISYDRPGYGGSTRDEGRDVASCVGDIAAVCDSLEVERFCVAGISGGGPHALAAAALLPDRVIAAASLASVAPYDADGLDWFAGMGEQNVEEMGAVLAGAETHRAPIDREREQLLTITPAELVDSWQTLLGPADRVVATGAYAEFLLEHVRAGVERTGDGWFDDDVAFVHPWGFDVATIGVPVLLWQGKQDRFVPFGHGVWLAERIPSVDARLTEEDGHLTLVERRIPEVHAWLVERATLSSDAAVA
jgi:pimeloyl-ACP methyl ester carboxylesterase